MGVMRILNSRWWSVGAVALVGSALLAGSAVAIYAVRVQPVLDGQLTLAGLEQPVRVRRDEADITHISAFTPQDLWRALGHVHAQERGWQLEFNRRLMHGTLSEVLGPATLDTDKLMRALDIRGAAPVRIPARQRARGAAGLQRGHRGLLCGPAHAPASAGARIHAAGHHAGRRRQLGLGARDSVGWALMMALDLGGNWGNEFARLAALSQLDTQQLWQLMPPYPGEAPATATDLAALYRGWACTARRHRRRLRPRWLPPARRAMPGPAGPATWCAMRAPTTARAATTGCSRAAARSAASPCWPTIPIWA